MLRATAPRPLPTGFSGNTGTMSGAYQIPGFIPTSTTSLALVTGRPAYTPPFYIDRPITVTKLAVVVSATGASSVTRLGLYTAGTNSKPAALAIDGGGTVDSSGSTGLKELTVSATIDAGWYVGAANCNNTAPTLYAWIGQSVYGVAMVNSAATWVFSNIYSVADGAGVDPTTTFASTPAANSIQSGSTIRQFLWLQYTHV